MKVSDYVADFFVNNGIKTVFTIVGGGAMHLNNSIGHDERIHCVYNHHEQACAIAAEAYCRINNEMAGVCVTSGPGAINALNGVIGAYQDSIPMIVVSGQTKTTLRTQYSGLPLRTFGNQEFDIVSALDNACKYAETITDPRKVRYCLEKAFYLARNGRPGPCWLDIPIDIQGANIDPEQQEGYLPEAIRVDAGTIIEKKIKNLLDQLEKSKRPVIYAGNGIRIAGAQPELNELAAQYGIPVVTCWDSIDLIETDSIYYAGRAGIMGDRTGNFAVQNSDFLLCIGNRLNVYQIGYQYDLWAREAYKVMVDIDALELVKPTISIDLPICYDAKKFLQQLLKKSGHVKVNNDKWNSWVKQCQKWKVRYPVVTQKQYEQKDKINIYAFIDKLSKTLPEKTVTVVANGSASVVGSAAYVIKSGTRFIMNCALASMGYDLPAAVGAACAVKQWDEKYCKDIICIAGDGSIQMNLQELQTIVTNRLPIKTIVINNEGYHQIRLTQTNLFEKKYVGIGPESNDLGFPDFSKLAYAYGIPYYECSDMQKMDEVLEKFLKQDGYAMLEIFCDKEQEFEPKSATKRLEDGTLYSPPLEDLYPFLPREELKGNMYIKIVE